MVLLLICRHVGYPFCLLTMKYSLSVPDFYLLRTPLLPYHSLTEISPEKIKMILKDAGLLEAVWVASPAFYPVLLQWLNDEISDAKSRKKIAYTAAKYLLRMGYRCTPFGRFAGVSIGKWATETAIELAEAVAHKPNVRLDIDYLCSLVAYMHRLPEIRSKLLYYPNTTLYKIGDQLRYLEYGLQKKYRIYELVHVEASVYVELLLQKATHGATIDALTELLTQEGIAVEEASAFIHEVIDNQVLVSELECNLTGSYYFSTILDTFSKRNIHHPIVSLLREVASELTYLNTESSSQHRTAFEGILSRLGTIKPESGQLLQVDTLHITCSNQLTHSVAEALKEALVFLATTQTYTQPENLRRFKEAFQERYEGRFVPLMEVLDAETGIGYASSRTETSRTETSDLLAHIPVQRATESVIHYPWSAWQQFLLDQYWKCIYAQGTEITFSAADLSQFSAPTNTAPLPDSLYTLCSVLAENSVQITNGNFLVYHKGTAGASMANLLSRFCYLDEELHQKIRQALDLEQSRYPDVVLAEIIHLNQTRAGNVSVRPSLRAYEIPIAARSGVDDAHTIPLNDLLIGIRNQSIVVFSQKLRKEVIPRLGTAHNYQFRSLPHYHFLCDLQVQNKINGLQWDWGMLQNAPFLPRVVYGKVILSVAQWTLSKEETTIVKTTQAHELLAAIRKIREQRNIPRFITVAEYDYELPIDLENLFLLELLQTLSLHKTQLVLKENLLQENNLFVQSPAGKHTHECIIPWHCSYAEKERVPSQNPETESDVSVTRSFSIGSEWLFFKIYGGVKTTDKILREVIEPLTTRLLADQTIDSWFFVRYNVPTHHIRVRFHEQDAFFSTVITQLYQALSPYLAEELVSSIQTDTYHRELERYGTDTMVASEQFFYYDSAAAIQILAMLDDDDEKLRWLLVLKGIDLLLDDFGLSLSEKKDHMDQLQKASKKEFQVQSTTIKKAMAHKYRQEKTVIEEILGWSLTGKKEVAVQILACRSQHLQPLIAAIRQKRKARNLPMDSLIGSYIHMFANRMFRSQPRKQEMMIYDFLFQYYTSRLAREKNLVKN